MKTVVFVVVGSREKRAAGQADREALGKEGTKDGCYVSPDTAHEWLAWRRDSYQFASLLSQDQGVPL